MVILPDPVDVASVVASVDDAVVVSVPEVDDEQRSIPSNLRLVTLGILSPLYVI